MAKLASMLARVLTFYSESSKMPELVESLRSDLPAAYESIPGFRGLLVLEKTGGNHVIALTLWDNEEGLRASEPFLEGFARQIREAVGTSVSRNIYTVLGRIGIGPTDESTG